MKVSLTAISLIALVLFLIPVSQNFGQIVQGDTMFIYSDPAAYPNSNLDDAILGDTTATGARKDPNRVYVLQQTGPLDTTFFFTQQLIVNFNLKLIGKNNPVTGFPPVVEPAINQDNGSAGTFCRENGNSDTVIFKNIYFLGKRPDGISLTGGLLYVNGDSSTAIIDHCIIENFRNQSSNGQQVEFGGNLGNLFITNTEFRNNQSDKARNPECIWQLHHLALDTVVLKDNTYFCGTGGTIGVPSPLYYFLFDHNTIFLGSDGPAFQVRQMTKGLIENNIFYGMNAMGNDTTVLESTALTGSSPGIIWLDTLTTLDTMMHESQRNIVIKNNVYSWPQGLYNYWTKYNDSTTSAPILKPTWMGPTTAGMFADKTTWPGLQAINNDSTDPDFSASLVSTAVDSMIKYFDAIWVNGTSLGLRWFQFPMNPANLYVGVSQDWASKQSYPVPENLSYTNSALYHAGTDGLPLGDDNWFPNITGVKQIPNTVPTKFNLSQNYPNPFNPSTQIKYTLPRSGFVSLKVYNILGQEVATLQSGFQKAGSYKVNFDASRLASGVYMYRLESNNLSMTKKMLLLK